MIGAFNTPGVSGGDEDLFRFNNAAWSLFFDGSDVQLTTANEDVVASHLDGNTLYLSTLGTFNARSNNGLTGKAGDVFTCTLTAQEPPITACTFAPFFSGSAHGLGTNLVDDLFVGQPSGSTVVAAEVNLSTAEEVEGDDVDDPDELDGTETS